MRRLLTVLAAFVVFDAVCVLRAQHGMTVTVEPERVVIGAEFMPRQLDLPVVTVVAAGVSATLDAGTYDTVEVAGTMTIPSIAVKVTHLVVLPGGTLIIECGAMVVGRNVPINTDRDPFQWGNGLLNFGTLRAVCPEKTPFVALSAPALAGATSLTLASQPVGWAVGDELVLPDTRQMGTPERETGTMIASMNGLTLGLSKPLAFARAAITRPDGSVVLQPRVANLSRRSVIASEDPSGVRWHVAHVGPDAEWDVSGVAFVGLGRTKNERLDNTSLGSHIGTNQVGRYAFHMHHVGSSLSTRRITSSAFDGKGGGKWSMAIHQSHDIEVIGNVCVDTPSACVSTEDGNEVRNVIRGNFAAYSVGNGVEARQNVKDSCPGCESAFWFRGVHNTIDGNEAWNSQIGFNLFNQQHAATGAYPSSQGSHQTTTARLADLTPLSFSNPIGASNREIGIEYWSVTRFETVHPIAAYNGRHQLANSQPDTQGEVLLIDASLIASGGVTDCLKSSQGYTHGVEMVRGEARGCAYGITDGIARTYGRFTDTVFQNVANLWFIQPGSWPQDFTMTRVTHEPFGANPPQYLHADSSAHGPGPAYGARAAEHVRSSHPLSARRQSWLVESDAHRTRRSRRPRGLPQHRRRAAPCHHAQDW
jgi:hypothetical protein